MILDGNGRCQVPVPNKDDTNYEKPKRFPPVKPCATSVPLCVPLFTLKETHILLFPNEAQRFTALWRSYHWSTISSVVVHAIIFPVLMLLFDSLAGLVLLYKSVSSVSSVVGNLALLLSGALVPLDGLGAVFTFLKYGFPMTWGISLLRQMTFLPGFLNTAEVAGLTLHTLLILGTGWLIFLACLHRARRQGALDSH